MTEKKKPGRPPKTETLQKRSIKEAEDKLMASRPVRVTPAENSAIPEMHEWVANLESARKQILKAYKHGQWTPDQHAYSMASVGDEWFHGKNTIHEEKILSEDEEHKSAARKIRTTAGSKIVAKYLSRRDHILELNSVLISKIGSGSAYTARNVAKTIRAQWYSMSEAQLLSGEPSSMNRRGDSGDPVSISTLERWFGAARVASSLTD